MSQQPQAGLDLIIVRVTTQIRKGATAALCGSIVHDHEGRFKLVFLLWNPALAQPPQRDELWLCRVLNEEQRASRVDGSITILPVLRHDTKDAHRDDPFIATYPTSTGQTIVVETWRFLPIFGNDPARMSALFPDLLAKIPFRERPGSYTHSVRLEEPCLVAPVIKTPPMKADEVTSFAQVRGQEFARRVSTSFTLAETRTHGCAISVAITSDGNQYRVSGIHAGRSSFQRSPIHTRDRGLIFWLTHALAYSPITMGPVFETTWRQALSKRY